MRASTPRAFHRNTFPLLWTVPQLRTESTERVADASPCIPPASDSSQRDPPGPGFLRNSPAFPPRTRNPASDIVAVSNFARESRLRSATWWRTAATDSDHGRAVSITISIGLSFSQRATRSLFTRRIVPKDVRVPLEECMLSVCDRVRLGNASWKSGRVENALVTHHHPEGGIGKERFPLTEDP